MARDSWLKRLIWLRGSPAGGSGASYEKTVGPAPIISIADAKAKPAKSLIVGMEPIQAGSGDPSPDNIRPISGRTGVTVERTGKNLFNLSEYAKANWSKVSDAEYPDTYTGYKHEFYHLYGDPSSNPDAKGLLGRRMPLGQVTISFYKYLSNNDAVYFHYVGDGNWTNHSGTFSTVGYVSFTSNANKICDGVAFDTIQGSTSKARFGALQIEIAAERTNYESYTGHTYPVTWQTAAGTVYGGTVDLVSGVLTVDRAQIASYNGEALPGKWISDRDVYAEGTSPTTGAQVVYELAEPQTYQLTPQQIQLLKGSNVLWSDADDLTLTYLGTTPANLLGVGYNPPAEQDPEELTEPEATETDEPAKETPAEEGENNGE